MLTKRDITHLEKVFATKADLRDLRDEFGQIFATKADLYDLHDKFDELVKKHDQLNEHILTAHSEIMGELQAIREELTVGGYRQARHSDQLEDHEMRIVKLESV